MKRHSGWWAVLAGGLAGGTLDILFAISFAAYNGIAAKRLLQSVASGLQGKEAYAGGSLSAALGLLLHFAMAFAFAAIFLLVSRRFPLLVRRPVVCGGLFGIGVFLFMRLVVLPLSAFPHPVTFRPLATTLDLLSHIFLFLAFRSLWRQGRLHQRRSHDGTTRTDHGQVAHALITQARMPLRAFQIFDLDGTISDPAVGIARSINFALRHYGYAPIDEGEVSRFIGPPIDQSFASIVGSASAEHTHALVAKFRERYAEVGYAENVIYPGVPEALQALYAADVPLGLCTSKRVDFAESILRLFGIRQYFRFVSGGDVGIPKSEQLATLLADGVIDKSSTMIGDRAVDVLAAKANGLRSVAVLWGHGSLVELRDASPDALLQSPHELLNLATHPTLLRGGKDSPTIAPAAADDAATILDIQRRAFAEEGRRSDNLEIPPLTESLDSLLEHIRNQTVLTARHGPRIVGSIRGIVAGTVCTIRALSIEPEHQGRGIGSSLLHAIEVAHPNVTHFELTTNTVMESNIRFYERHGYHITELTRHSDKITLAQMMKSAVAGVGKLPFPAQVE